MYSTNRTHEPNRDRNDDIQTHYSRALGLCTDTWIYSVRATTLYKNTIGKLLETHEVYSLRLYLVSSIYNTSHHHANYTVSTLVDSCCQLKLARLFTQPLRQNTHYNFCKCEWRGMISQIFSTLNSGRIADASFSSIINMVKTNPSGYTRINSSFRNDFNQWCTTKWKMVGLRTHNS